KPGFHGEPRWITGKNRFSRSRRRRKDIVGQARRDTAQTCRPNTLPGQGGPGLPEPEGRQKLSPKPCKPRPDQGPAQGGRIPGGPENRHRRENGAVAG